MEKYVSASSYFIHLLICRSLFSKVPPLQLTLQLASYHRPGTVSTFTHKQVPGSLQDSRLLCQALEQGKHKSWELCQAWEDFPRWWLCCEPECGCGSSQERWTCTRTKEQRRLSSCVVLQVKTLSANPDDPGTHVVEGEKWLLQIVL